MSKIVGSYSKLAIGLMMEKLYPGAIDDLLLLTGDVTLVSFEGGSTLATTYGLESKASTWRDSTEYGALAAKASKRGLSYLGTLLESQSPSYTVVGDSLLLTNAVGGGTVGKSNYVNTSITKERAGVILAETLGTPAALRATLAGCVAVGASQNPSPVNSSYPGITVYLQPDAEMVTKLTAFCRAFGETYLASHPIAVDPLASYQSFSTEAGTSPSNGAAPVAGMEYISLFVGMSAGDAAWKSVLRHTVPAGTQGPDGMTKDEDRKWPEDFVNSAWTVSGVMGSMMAHIAIPVAASTDHKHPYLAVADSYATPNVWSVTYFGTVTDLRYKAITGPQMVVPVYPGDGLYYKYSPGVKTVNGTPKYSSAKPASITGSGWLALAPSAKAAFLPLIAPPGALTYHFEMRNWKISEPELIGEYGGSKLWLKRIVGVARNALLSFPASWYEAYISTGFGIYTPLKGDALTKALDNASDLQGMTMQAAVPPNGYAVPTDVVTRLEFYKSYKRGREKACKLNDFMSRDYAPGIKWEAVNRHFGTLATGVSAMFAITPTTPLVSDAPVVDTTWASAYTITGVKTVKDGVTTLTLTAPANSGIDVNDAGSVAEALAGGAKLSGFVVADLDVVWAGFSSGYAETGAFKAAVSKSYAETSTGTPEAVYSFQWKDVGVNGYPVYDEMPVQSAYKAVIASEMLYKSVGAKLVQAANSFSLATISKIVASD